MIENKIYENRQKENMVKCLELADKGKQFEIQKNNKIMMLKDQRERNELTNAEILKQTLTKSNKSYQKIKKQRNDSQNNSLQKMSITPEIPKLKISSMNDSPVTPVVTRSTRSKLPKDNQSNKQMLVQMRQKLIKNLTDRDEKEFKQQSQSKTRLINIQTERIDRGHEVKHNFMSVTKSKKQ